MEIVNDPNSSNSRVQEILQSPKDVVISGPLIAKSSAWKNMIPTILGFVKDFKIKHPNQYQEQELEELNFSTAALPLCVLLVQHDHMVQSMTQYIESADSNNKNNNMGEEEQQRGVEGGGGGGEKLVVWGLQKGTMKPSLAVTLFCFEVPCDIIVCSLPLYLELLKANKILCDKTLFVVAYYIEECLNNETLQTLQTLPRNWIPSSSYSSSKSSEGMRMHTKTILCYQYANDGILKFINTLMKPKPRRVFLPHSTFSAASTFSIIHRRPHSEKIVILCAANQDADDMDKLLCNDYCSERAVSSSSSSSSDIAPTNNNDLAMLDSFTQGGRCKIVTSLHDFVHIDFRKVDVVLNYSHHLEEGTFWISATEEDGNYCAIFRTNLNNEWRKNV